MCRPPAAGFSHPLSARPSAAFFHHRLFPPNHAPPCIEARGRHAHITPLLPAARTRLANTTWRLPAAQHSITLLTVAPQYCNHTSSIRLGEQQQRLSRVALQFRWGRRESGNPDWHLNSAAFALVMNAIHRE